MLTEVQVMTMFVLAERTIDRMVGVAGAVTVNVPLFKVTL
jgi:hypothetical protein